MIKKQILISFLCSVASGAGVHWFVVHRRSAEAYEVFDSLGASGDFIKTALPRKGHCYYNETQVQAKESDNCGQFCVYFIIERFFNYDLPYSEVRSSCFSADPLKNEEEVAKFIENLVQSKHGRS